MMPTKPRCMSIPAFARMVGVTAALVREALRGNKKLPAPAVGTWTSARGRVFIQVEDS